MLTKLTRKLRYIFVKYFTIPPFTSLTSSPSARMSHHTNSDHFCRAISWPGGWLFAAAAVAVTVASLRNELAIPAPATIAAVGSRASSSLRLVSVCLPRSGGAQIGSPQGRQIAPCDPDRCPRLHDPPPGPPASACGPSRCE